MSTQRRLSTSASTVRASVLSTAFRVPVGDTGSQLQASQCMDTMWGLHTGTQSGKGQLGPRGLYSTGQRQTAMDLRSPRSWDPLTSRLGGTIHVRCFLNAHLPPG